MHRTSTTTSTTITVGRPGSSECLNNLQIMLKVCNDTGTPVEPEKTEGPSEILVFLGIEIDTTTMQLRLPAEKLARLKDLLLRWRGKKECRHQDPHACKVVKPGRTFLRENQHLLTLPSSPVGKSSMLAADLMESRKLIPDLATWIQCFSVYAAVVIGQEPERTKNLLAYMLLMLIAKCSLWPSCMKDWSKVKPSTYTQCFTGAAISQDNWCRRCHSIDHATESCPIKPLNVQRKREGPHFPAGPPLRSDQHFTATPRHAENITYYDGDCRFGVNCMFHHKCESWASGHHVPKS